MNGRHVAAQGRVSKFIRAWREMYPNRPKITTGFGILDLTVVDLETLMQPRQVIRTIEQLQALPAGTIIVVQSGRAAQVETAEAYDGATGEELEAKRLVYAGTDLDDYLLPEPLGPETRDTLRRMLPATVIDTKEN